MTMIEPVFKKCAICGIKNKYLEIMSSNSFGYPDLDSRPSEMSRSTMNLWIQRCPRCGYCSSDVSKEKPYAQDIIKSEHYRAQLSNFNFPELANSFLCSSIINISQEHYARAAWDTIHAAWTCDDEKLTEAATQWRIQACKLFLKARKLKQKFAEDEGEEYTVLADLYRRSGQFEEARNICHVGLAKKPEELVTNILRFQLTLIEKADVSCHKISESIPNYEAKKLQERRKYSKPGKVKMLILGECIPASGKFFYNGDSDLYHKTEEAFSRAFEVEFSDQYEFIRVIKNRGFFQDDLCHEPIDGLDTNEREKKRAESVGLLADRLLVYYPETIIVADEAIVPYVKSAIKLVNMEATRFYSLPYPDGENAEKYVEELTQIIKEVLPPFRPKKENK